MTTPAGWYDDPAVPGTGRARWWDGTTWTDHTQVVAVPGSAPGVPAGQYGPVTPDGAALANVWLRLAAFLIDGVATGIVQLVLVLPWLGGYIRGIDTYTVELEQAIARGEEVDVFGFYTTPGVPEFLIASVVISYLVSALHTIVLTATAGGTVGQLLLGLRVRRWEEPGNVSWGRSAARWAGEVLPAQITCGLWQLVNYLWCLWDPRRQTLHDKIAGTVVIRKG